MNRQIKRKEMGSKKGRAGQDETNGLQGSAKQVERIAIRAKCSQSKCFERCKKRYEHHPAEKIGRNNQRVAMLKPIEAVNTASSV